MDRAKKYKALKELERIQFMKAFNVQGYESKHKTNKYHAYYYFDDGSCLVIYAQTSKARAWHKDYKHDLNSGTSWSIQYENNLFAPYEANIIINR